MQTDTPDFSYILAHQHINGHNRMGRLCFHIPAAHFMTSRHLRVKDRETFYVSDSPWKKQNKKNEWSSVLKLLLRSHFFVCPLKKVLFPCLLYFIWLLSELFHVHQHLNFNLKVRTSVWTRNSAGSSAEEGKRPRNRPVCVCVCMHACMCMCLGNEWVTMCWCRSEEPFPSMSFVFILYEELSGKDYS